MLHEAERLERANYLALLPVSAVTPGLELLIRDDVILTSSQMFPAPDTTHACALHAGPDTINALLDEVTGYFQAKELPVNMYVSPACTPADLGERLRARGFVQHEHDESWVVLDNLDVIVYHSQRTDIEMQPVGVDDALTFAETFLTAFEMPVEFAPPLAEILKPSIGLPTTFHFLAREAGQPIGTISLIIHEQYGIVGSTGILPEFRKTRVVVEMFRAIHTTALQHSVKILFAQTRFDSTAERLLLANSFRRSFVRQGYTLSE